MSTIADRLAEHRPYTRRGRVRRVVGLEVHASGLSSHLGELVWILGDDGRIPAEVIAVDDDDVRLMPFASPVGLGPGRDVESTGAHLRVPLGDGIVGRVLDALGRPADGAGPIKGAVESVDVESAPVPAMARGRISEPLQLGVRAVDTLLTCGRGQRVGIMAGSGVGKSTLLGMLARGTDADAVVVALVGERGREVREFLEDDLGPGGRERATVVVATADEPPLLRLRAALTATRIAEWHADRGESVLLLMDSLTRFAMAQREIGLAAGEPPTTRGYPPSTFGAIARLLERAGPRERGTITGLYTVLVEGDDLTEPITDHARSILDGHIVLSRRLATAGHYPTIDVTQSVSRLAGKLWTPAQQQLAVHTRRLLAAVEESRDLVEIGAYVAGTNHELDEALLKRTAIDQFLRQGVHEVVPMSQSWNVLEEVLR
ncbi:MAG: FliI/YscN family ATPase [Actinomycetota bacterium]|nr:FliI/YscN family ATPase [Actinomycetota bacterium]